MDFQSIIHKPIVMGVLVVVGGMLIYGVYKKVKG